MPLDYRLAMAQPTEVGGTLKNILAIGELRDQDRARQQARIDAERAKQAEAILTQTIQQNADRPDEAVTALRKAGFAKEANDFEVHLSKVRKAKLDERGAMIDQEYKLGQIDKQRADAEKAAIAAVDPMDALPFVAMAESQEDYDNGLGLIKFKFGPKADAVIAQLPPQWSPEVSSRLSNILLGPKGVADIANQKADNERIAATAEQAAADRAAANARMESTAAEAARHNRVMEGQGAQRIGQSGAGSGGALTETDKKIADLVVKSPAMYRTLTAAVRTRIAPLLAERGFNLPAEGAAGQGGEGKLAAAAIEKVAAIDQARGMIDDIDALVPKMSGYIGPIDGRWARGRLRAGTDVPKDLADFDTQITALKNAVIKATTGAAMSEPEAQRIMGQIPDMSNSEQVFKSRLAITRKNIELLKKRTIELSGGTVAGDTSAAPKKLTAEELIKKYGGG